MEILVACLHVFSDTLVDLKNSVFPCMKNMGLVNECLHLSPTKMSLGHNHLLNPTWSGEQFL